MIAAVRVHPAVMAAVAVAVPAVVLAARVRARVMVRRRPVARVAMLVRADLAVTTVARAAMTAVISAVANAVRLRCRCLKFPSPFCRMKKALSHSPARSR